jgi:hypothetical protein
LVTAKNAFYFQLTFAVILMKRHLLLILSSVVFLISGCKNKSGLPADARQAIPVGIARFDQDFFNLDTANIMGGLEVLAVKYPDFLPGYLSAILGIDPTDPRAPEAIKAFLRTYRPVYALAQEVTKEYLPTVQTELEEGLQWMRYLVPSFKPDSAFTITTFIGPMDAFENFSIGDYGDVRTANGVGVALQLHLGADAQVYLQGIESGIFFNYQVRRFSPEMITVNAMKNIIDDHFPYTAAGKPLVEEMVEKGKRMYLVKRLLPDVEDSLLTGYTGNQLKGCFENEEVIWQFFVKNDLLYSIEPTINQQFIRDGPKTPELGEASPGYIGLFTGWRIVETYMDKNPGISIEQLMQTPSNTLFQGSGYRPK